jgi:hypothetical protein
VLHTKSKWLPTNGPLASNTILLATIADPDWRIIVLFIQKSSLAYEKKGASIYLYPTGIWQGSNKKIYINKYLLQHTGEELHVPRTIIVFGLGKAREVVG